MAHLTISSAASLTGATTASGDLFPCLDVSAASGSQGSKITRDELGDAMTRTAAMIAALAAKLDLAGGTMTGVLTAAAGSASTPSITFTGATSNTGFYCSAADRVDVSINGNNRFFFTDAGFYTSGTSINVNGGNIIGSYAYLRVDGGGGLSLGTSDDLKLGRAAAASLQLGADHATTPTDQTIKAHNVTTGTGAALKLCGGTGSAGKGAVIIGDATDMPAGFHGYATPQAEYGWQAAAYHAQGTSANVTEDSTFGNFTLGQVVQALKDKGILA